MRAILPKLIAALSFAAALSAAAAAWQLPGLSGRVGSLTVYVSGEYGEPLDVPVDMSLTPDFFTSPVPIFPHEIGRGWLFDNVPAGNEYQLDIRAKGYETVHRSVDLPDVPGFAQSMIIYMKRIDETLIFHPPSGQFALTPKAQKELQNGLKDFQARKFSSGQKHVSKALALDPGNPYANYVAGIGYLLDHQAAAAEPYLEKSVSIDSRQVPALVALGNLEFQKSNYPEALRVLQRAVELDPVSWKSQWVLADCYLHQQEFQPALDHARQALQLGKEKANQVELLVGEALAGLGNRQGAKAAIEEFLAKNPHYPTVPAIRSWLATLDSAPVASPRPVAEQTVSVHPVAEHTAVALVSPPPPPPSAPPVELPPKADWAPKDIDAESPFVISGAACALPKVLEMASKNAERVAANLQKFEATEETEIVEVKRNQSLEVPVTYKSRYMVTIDRSDPKGLQLEELRKPPPAPGDMPGGIADLGAPGLVLAFHPLYRQSFDWSCEGLGEWRDQPAWIVRFSQKPERPTALLSAFETLSQRYPLPLKGRAWIAANGGEIMHLETDLVSPITKIALEKQHFVIDYAPVPFRNRKITLWLPEDVNLYLQYQRHYLHYYHHYSNFTLFWVGTSEKIAAPKQAKLTN